MATPFFVPLLSGALIKRQEISDEYDNTAGDIIDAASANYKSKLKGNEARIKLQDSNYAAVETAFGTTVAEAAAKYGLLEGVETSKVVNHVDARLNPGLKKSLQELNLAGDKKSFFYKDPNDPKTISQKQLFDSIFKEDISVASSKVDAQKDWASKNLNKGAISNVSKMFLGEQDKPKSFVEKTQNVLFGEKPDKAVFDAAAEKNLGETVTVQPSSSEQIASLEEIIGYNQAYSIGTVGEQDKAIANILDIKEYKLGGDGGILFPVRFRSQAIAIKDEAMKYALDYTDANGKVDVSNLMNKANNEITSNIIAPIAENFISYKVDTESDFAKSMSFRVMEADGINFESKHMKNYELTEEDFKFGNGIVGPGNRIIKRGAIVTKKAKDAWFKEIAMQGSRAAQAVYIDYLPDNFMYQGQELKQYYKNIFKTAAY